MHLPFTVQVHTVVSSVIPARSRATSPKPRIESAPAATKTKKKKMLLIAMRSILSLLNGVIENKKMCLSVLAVLALQEDASTCKETDSMTPKFRALANFSSLYPLTGSAQKCYDEYAGLPRKSQFFSRISPPAGMPLQRFQHMLAKGGIHPHGVLLDSEFFELPLEVDATRLQQELEALVTSTGWDAATDANVNQGKHRDSSRSAKFYSKILHIQAWSRGTLNLASRLCRRKT